MGKNKLPIPINHFYLYGLYCPYTNNLKYVGITTRNLSDRLTSHLRTPTNKNISMWFNELKSDSKKPEIKLISEYQSRNDLLHAETNKIKKCREVGIKLFNISDGGSVPPMLGKKHSETTKNIMRKNNIGENNPMFGKSLSNETLKKRSEKVISTGIYREEKNPNFKFYITKDNLINFYITENKNISSIAEIYGCCEGVIKRNLKKYNIQKPISNKYNLNIDEILLYKKEGMNLIKIGKKYGCSNKIINKFLKRHTNGK
jgi:hypothetical protein